MREIIERGIREGYFRAVDPVLTHFSLLGSLIFFFATAEFRNRVVGEGLVPIGAPGADAYVRYIQELVARGLAADAAPSR